ncbi:MAG: ABC transporter substrate-binding protein [Betaproteobacteria bacterium]|nr:ABC transporter substrate-binding protein [Betaproteobacteria bacterium]
MSRRCKLFALLLRSIAISMLCAIPPASAQTSQKIHRLAILELWSEEFGRNTSAAFERGLKDLGYIEGKNLAVERRFADGRAERLPALATELVRTRPDVIFAPLTPAAHAAKTATDSIPIVIALASDPVASGFAASLARPGGNVTGTSNIQTDVDPKRLQILKEAFPKVARVALVHAGDRLAQIQLASAQRAGTALGIEIVSMEARQPDDYRRGFTAAKAHRIDAILVAANGQNGANHLLIFGLAAEQRLAAIYPEAWYAENGGLMSYGTQSTPLYYRAATFVDKIFKGARPGELPIEQPTTFDLVVNLKVAKAAGLTIPRLILTRADRVIE